MKQTAVTPAKAGVHKHILNQVRTNITPKRVVLFDGVDFPVPLPGFDHFFVGDSISNVIKDLEIDKRFDTIFFGETVDQPFSVLKSTADKVAGDSNVQRTVTLASHDVNISTFVHQPDPANLCLWMPAYAGMTLKESEARHG
jgi:hypothetical protein